MRKRCHGRLLDDVEAAVILAEAPRLVLLPRKYGCSVGGAGMDDPALEEQEGHLPATFVELALRPPLHRPRARHGMRASVDS